jgi:hypothetical protein
MHSTLGPRMALDYTYLTWSTYCNHSPVINSIGRILLLARKNAPDSPSQPNRVAHRIHISFSPNTTIKEVGLTQTFIDSSLLGLLGPYLHYAISTFNTCSWGGGGNPLILNCHRRGVTTLEVPTWHITLPTLPNQWSSAFHLRVPPGLSLNNQPF